ncbi:MAG: hypothetical protein WC250_01440 [Candidatus Paceibacterota bacterium]|jgi:hypothetical protein
MPKEPVLAQDLCTPPPMTAFLQSEPLSQKQWVSLLEARRMAIVPLLDRLTLPEIGSVELDGGSHEGATHPIADDKPNVRYSQPFQKSGLANQAVIVELGSLARCHVTSHFDGVCLVVGISRLTKNWFSVLIGYGYDKKRVNYRQAREVLIFNETTESLLELKSVTSAQIIEINPGGLWESLGDAVHRYCEKKRAADAGIFKIEQEFEDQRKVKRLHDMASHLGRNTP